MLHLAKGKKGALTTTRWGGVLTLLLLLALLFVGCNLDGDSGNTSDSGSNSGGTSDSGSAGTSHADETGSGYLDSSNVYHVYGEADLEAWATDYSTYSCTLHACIILSDEWEPVGTTYSTAYTATFDGGGHKISNLKIDTSDDYAGFFGYVRSGGEVSDLTLENPNVSGANYVGAVVGYNYGGTIEGCIVSGGMVSGSSTRVGGIVGYNYSGTVKYCENSAAVSGDGMYVGGVVGYNYDTVSSCTNSGTISGTTYYVGGIVGSNGSSSTVSGCENSGNVSGESTNVGGIAGNNYGEVIDCANSGTVTGSSYQVGGIVGSNGTSATVSGCENSGAVSGSNYVGGIAGENYNEVSSCDNSGGSVSSIGTGSYIGAVAGYNYGTVSECKYLSSTASKGIGGGTDSGATSYDVS